MKIILLGFLVSLAYTQCADGEQYYYGTCLEDNCFDYFYRIKLTGIRDDGSGMIHPGIALETKLVEGEGVKVSLYYFDDEDYYADRGGRLESNCVQAFVYSNKGLYPSVQKRINVNSNGRAEWPILTKIYDEASSNTITSFMVTISDLKTRGCKQSEVDGNQQFACYFEYAWEVREVALAKYFFHIVVQVNTDLTVVTKADFQPFIGQEPNPPACYLPDGSAEEVCVQSIDSALLYCKDSTCKETSTEPYEDLNQYSDFWIVHKITDERFSDKKLLFRDLMITANNSVFYEQPQEKREEDGQIVMLVSTFISYIFKDFILTSEAYVKDLNLEEGEHREYFYHRDYANLNVKINEVKENNNVSFLIIIFASLGSICFIICNIVCIFYYCASLCRC